LKYQKRVSSVNQNLMQVPKVKTFFRSGLLFRQGTRVFTPAFVAGLQKQNHYTPPDRVKALP